MDAARPPSPSPPRRRRTALRGGFTLVELLVSMTVSVILLGGLTSAIMMAARSIDTGDSPTSDTRSGNDALDWIETDLTFAIDVQTSDNEITITVPDRDDPPDEQPEVIHYRWSGTPGHPLTRQFNADPEVTIVDNVTDLEFVQPKRTLTATYAPPVLDPASWGYVGGDSGVLNTEVLLVVADAAAPSLQTLSRKSELESWNATVKLISDHDDPAAFETGITTAGVVYVTQECDEVELFTKLRDARIGVCVEPFRTYDDFSFSQAGSTRTDTKVDLVGSVHPITAGLPSGNFTILDSSQKLGRLDGDPPASLVTLAEAGGDPSLAIIDTGGIRYDETPSPSRRVSLPFGGDDFDFNSLNANGLALLRRSLAWAAEKIVAQQFGHTTEYTTGVTNVEKTQIATKVTMPEVGTVSSVTAYIDPQNKKLRFAIYDDIAGEPGSLIVESEVAQLDLRGWKSLTVDPTVLPAGTYWLALVFERNNQYYFHDSPGQTRYLGHDAIGGFQPTWGTSSDSFAVSVSIYATYTPN